LEEEVNFLQISNSGAMWRALAELRMWLALRARSPRRRREAVERSMP
jgi:hypothetical protein